VIFEKSSKVEATVRSRRHNKADCRGLKLNPLPYVGGYRLWDFHSCREIFGLTLSFFGLLLFIALSANPARAATSYWDPTGATPTPSPNGNWEDFAWSTNSALTATPTNFASGNAAAFAAGTIASGAYSVTLNTTQNVAGIFNGLTLSIGTVTINGSGAINMPSGQQPFYTVSPGSTIINVPIGGIGQMVVEQNGQLYLDATNTFTGGTLLGITSAPFTGTVFINNNSSFGTGRITMFSSGSTIALQGIAAVTLPNPVSTAAATLNIIGNPAGLTFNGAWTMTFTANIGTLGAANQVIISGPMSGAAGLNKFGPGLLRLTAANSYLGSTVISNGTLALAASGSINSSNIVIVPGPDGSVFDVSAKTPFTLASTLVAEGFGTSPSTAATIRGAAGSSVSLNFRPLNLVFTAATFNGDTSHPSLYSPQGTLALSGTIVTVTNAAPTPLGIGTYRLIQVSNGFNGVITGLPNSESSFVVGSGVAAGTDASFVVTNGNLNLVVKPGAVFSGFSLTQSNTIGVGVTSVTLSGTVSAGSIYPAQNENIGTYINNSFRNVPIKDTVGDFSFTFAPTAIPYAATNNFTYNYSGDAVLAQGSATVLVPGHAFYAGDAAPGFTSGMNLFFTNTSGIQMFTWSATNTGLPVTDWTLESPMDEQPLNDGTGKSRYSINVNPASALVYYICGPSIAWPYLNSTTVQSITTDSQGGYTFIKTGTTITPAGLLSLPAPPAIIQQPLSQTILLGKNATFNAMVVGSQPLAYQWYFDTDTPLPGAQSKTLSLVSAVASNAGNYTLVVTNNYGSTTSAVANLTLAPPPSITSQATSNGFQLSGLSLPGLAFNVQASTNLLDWTTIFTNLSDTNGLLLFTDASVSTTPIRFFRVLFP
jgi:autotransporter-associated beta strand protein